MSSEFFAALVGAISVVAGAVASVAGFGIGSLVTPVMATGMGIKTAIAAVAVPHAAGTALRLWHLRGSVDREVLRSFGLASAAGGLAGALVHGAAASPVVSIAFAGLLVMAGASGLFGLAERIRLRGAAAWAAGILSGGFGGLAGNQGGIRSAALLGFGLQRDAFVATATAVALIVDAARMPVYLVTSGDALIEHWGIIAFSTAGVLLGTVFGTRLLHHIPERTFRRVVSALVLLLGLFLLVRAL